MALNIQEFYQACNPSKTLLVTNPDDRRYYIDFASVRGGKIIEELRRTIVRLSPDEPTCQLFAGHIGCGKSTELVRLQAELAAANFTCIYFESSEDLEMADVDVTDILLAVARQVSDNLEMLGIVLQPVYFQELFREIVDFLQVPLDISGGAGMGMGIAQIMVQTKASYRLRSRLRQYLEPRTSAILAAINSELIRPAIEQLKGQGSLGLVVIVDNLDRVDTRLLTNGRTQPEHLFIDRGEQLRKLECHMVWTIPLSLIFSGEIETLKNRLGGGVSPKVLPMVPVQQRDGSNYPEGMKLLQQMVLARAFPELEPTEQEELLLELVDAPASLERLCRASGGHIRNLLSLLYRCLQQQDPPFPRDCVEMAIHDRAAELALAVSAPDWPLLQSVRDTKSIRESANTLTLLRSLFVFEYRGAGGERWFDINPLLAEHDLL